MMLLVLFSLALAQTVSSHSDEGCEDEHESAASKATCFHGDGVVGTVLGPKMVRDLMPGDEVLCTNDHGELMYSPVKYQLHPKNEQSQSLLEITTEIGIQLSLTRQHLIFITDCTNRDFSTKMSKLAKEAAVGDCVFVVKPNGVDEGSSIGVSKISRIRTVEHNGVYAPITTEGTIIVNGIAASCYSYVPNHDDAHRMFTILGHLPHNTWKIILDPKSTEQAGSWIGAMSKLVTITDDGICFGRKKAPMSDELV